MYFPVGWSQIESEEHLIASTSSSHMALAVAVDLVLKLWGYIGIKLVKVGIIERKRIQLDAKILTNESNRL